MSTRLGIDFGTTRTVVASSDRGNYPVVGFHDTAGTVCEWFPSVIAARDGELRYGFEALALAADPAWTVVRSFKRLLSEPTLTPDQRVVVGAREYEVGELVTGFLLALRRALVASSPRPDTFSGTLEAVVATPAHALGPQRFLTIDAFRRAGFDLVALLNEPSAAGFEYSHRFRRTLTSQREHVLVYDLGGGTFDASLVKMHGLHHDVVATGGDAQLGGDDFDAVLVRLALEQLKLQPARLSPRQRAGLLERARDAKERLNPNSRRVPLELEELGLDDVTVSAADYFDACLPLVEKTLAAMQPVLDRAGADESQLAGVYVVGGASALPVVSRRLKEAYGRRVHRSPYPSAAVAIGLAIAGDETAGFELTDRLSRVFGVFRERDGGHDVSFDTIFERDEAVPLQGARRPLIQREYRAAHNVGRYRFVETNELDARGLPHFRLRAVGELMFPFDQRLRNTDIDLRQVPVERLGRPGPLVRETYTVTALGLVEVALMDVETGFERRYTLGR
ncbi:MAG: Hsp70 family protein [Myxococcaceae bacterium]|nr:Hsp70 family protein [Myxococcaceae bacterium]